MLNIERHYTPNCNNNINNPQEIVIHYWGSPNASFDGVVNWLCNPRAGVSAHFVVGGTRVARLARDCDTTWHAGNWWHNTHSIGIECQTIPDEETYDTVGKLVSVLWKEHGKLPLIRHKDIVSTSCPGTYDLNKIRQIAEKYYNGESVSKPVAVKPTVTANTNGNTIASIYNASEPLTVQQAIAKGQALSNLIVGGKIAVDGIWGADTKRNATRVLQWALNKDYDLNLDIDGLWGTATSGALNWHYVRRGETQYMVTALEVLLLMNGYNPHGVEIQGQFGEGLEKATVEFQSDNGLEVDGIAGRNTFKKLIEA